MSADQQRRTQNALNNELIALEKSAQKRKQLNRQIELNTELKCQRTEVEGRQ